MGGIKVAIPFSLVLLGCGAEASSGAPAKTGDDIATDYKARLAAVHDRARRQVVWIKCETPQRHPEAECGLLANQYITEKYLTDFQAAECKETGDRLSSTCIERFKEFFFKRLTERYPLAKPEGIKRHCLEIDCGGLQGLEIAGMFAHNDVVHAREDAEMAALMENARADFAERRQRLEREAEEREQRAATARAVGAALAGAASGMGAALSARQHGSGYSPAPSSPPMSSYSPPPSRSTSAGCSSDFECGFGNVCVKSQFQFNGTCAKAVNEYGTPTYQAPRGESIGPGGPGQCGFDTECPMGFHCQKSAGALRGNCMK